MIHTDEVDFQTLPVFPSERRTLKEELDWLVFQIENRETLL